MYTGKYFDNKTAVLTNADIQLHAEYLEFNTGRDTADSHFSWLYKDLDIRMSGKTLRINHPSEGGLEIHDSVCIDSLLKLVYPNRRYSIYNWVRRLGNKAALSIAASLMLIAALCYFYVLPALAEHVAQHLPKSFDEELGKLVRSTMEEPSDAKGSRLLTAFASKINWENGDSLSFSVSPRDIDNAYAVPGGTIVVYQALLKKIKTKEELAALLAHESSHIKFRHSTRKLCKQMSASILIQLFFGNIGAFSTLYSNADAINSLSYSRQYEKEADLEGLTLLRDNKIDQHGMLQLMQILSGIKHKVDIPTFLSTHPLTQDRIKYVDEQIKANPAPVTPHEDLEKIFREIKALYPS
ncbi:M48 family metallopeptidase [Chitinophaga sp. Cy-1792]|uniref:M48 family metallopeptidase n=1 Tax=Chitinophaga sp. Cy-1792 TaxID=2608339 RepID=UPI001422A36D|nr:M48 family metallopeptidase [Chitinophaga sp. Cy-1792]NIG54886.1 M48 family metallopeptidase [Chitinophaga sp. Cy-1792]